MQRCFISPFDLVIQTGWPHTKLWMCTNRKSHSWTQWNAIKTASSFCLDFHTVLRFRAIKKFVWQGHELYNWTTRLPNHATELPAKYAEDDGVNFSCTENSTMLSWNILLTARGVYSVKGCSLLWTLVCQTWWQLLIEVIYKQLNNKPDSLVVALMQVSSEFIWSVYKVQRVKEDLKGLKHDKN
jgi:hypothetical protein